MMAQNKRKVYHGTSAAAAESIRKEQHFRESREEYEWLGWGAYFFEYERHAWRWIENQKLHPGEVLAVQLEYNDRELLDLDDPAQLDAVNREMERMNRVLKNRISVEPGEKHEKRKRWCFSCNMYRKLHPEIGIISYTFPQKRRPGQSGFAYNERQICVSKDEIITEIT